MNRRRITSIMRTLSLLAGMLAVALQPAAQDRRLPPPETPESPVNQWVVTLTPGTDPFAVAGRMGLIVERELAPNTYVMRAGNELRTLTAETLQTFDVGLARSPEVIGVAQQVLLDRPTRDPSDPLFPDQWHLENTGQDGGTPGADANVVAAWDQGFTGTGVVVSSVDDGLYHTNPDLAGNYLASASWDFGGIDPDPSGGGHGTNVGGVMAADDDGSACGVGAAYNAQLSGLKLLNAPTDANEAAALTYDGQTIDIYNSSWGPSDSGAVLEGPGPLTESALADGIANGRGGLGSIYVWASGNGKTGNDNVNADGYANSRYTIAVAATTNQSESSWYSEQGSPILINAPSNGGTAGITTTSGSSGCTSSFGGTSSASPLAAGIVALMLQAKPDLTWRDVQHILVHTAEKNDPSDSGWFNNDAGLHYNHFYGFGRIDADAAVTLAETWTNVLPELTFDSGTIAVNQAIPDGPSGAFVTSTFNVAEALKVESVDVVFDADHDWRGDLRIELVSPNGTTSVLMHGRPNDSGNDYNNWRLNTVANWDEVSAGTWTIRVQDLLGDYAGTFNSWRLQIHGTSLSDTYISNQPDDAEVLYDESTTLTVGAVGGDPIHYQWYQGISGDTSSPVGTDSPSFTTPALQTTAQYWVRATGTESSADSNTATLTVVSTVDMLDDALFNLKSPAEWTFNNSEGKIKCNKQYVSPTCAARLRNGIPQVARMSQSVSLGVYPWSIRAGDTLKVALQAKTPSGAKAKVRLNVKYDDDTLDKVAAKFTADGVWQLYTLDFTLTRSDISKIKLIVMDMSVTTGINVWVDDATLQQERLSSGRGADAVLPPPPAPDGFRGGN